MKAETTRRVLTQRRQGAKPQRFYPRTTRSEPVLTQIGEADFYVREFGGSDAPKLGNGFIYFGFDGFKVLLIGFRFGGNRVGLFAQLGKMLVQNIFRVEFREADVFQDVRRGLRLNPVTFHDENKFRASSALSGDCLHGDSGA